MGPILIEPLDLLAIIVIAIAWVMLIALAGIIARWGRVKPQFWMILVGMMGFIPFIILIPLALIGRAGDYIAGYK